MRRVLTETLLLAVLASAPALADPGITVAYQDELLRVTLDGSYAGAFYQVWRSPQAAGPYEPLSQQYSLCTGDCFVSDFETTPGATYFYRFDLVPPEGGSVSYGPYAVAVPGTPLAARVSPNPSNGAARIELSVPGSGRRDAPLPAEARILDVQGRTVRVLHSAPLARGVTSIAWDGRGDAGQALGAGIYFLRLSTPLGTSMTRIVRFR